MKKHLHLFLILNLCFAGLFAQTTVTIKPINGTGKDAVIVTGASSSNYGNHLDVGASTWTCSGSLCLQRSLIEFDLSFIPAGSTINSATLNLYSNVNSLNGIAGQPTYGIDNAGYVRRITQSWNEMSVTWDNQPATSTQNQVVIPQSATTSDDYELDVTALTQDIIDNPTTGYGFMISEQNETTWYNSLFFGSSDNTDLSIVPSLVVTYTPPSSDMICFELQPGGAEGKDAVIVTGDSNGNYGNHLDVGASTWTCSGSLCLERSLIEFNLSSIPTTATIDSAFLYFYANVNSANGISGQPTYGTDNAGYLRRITQSWDEMTVNWNNQPQTTPQDQVLLPQSSSSAQDYVLDLKNLVQTYIQNPTSSFGFMLMEQNETTWYNSLFFGSSDNSDQSIRPLLKICYTPATGINENAFSSLSIYPNPFNSSFTISDRNNSISKVEVYNAIGEMVYINDHVHGEITIDAGSFSNGIYFTKIFSEKGFVVRKMVKN